MGQSHYGAERKEIGEARAQRLVKDALRELGWTEAELSQRSKGDKFKVSLARRLRAETTMTLAWIADPLKMGSWTHLSNLLHEKSKNQLASIVMTDTCQSVRQQCAAIIK